MSELSEEHIKEHVARAILEDLGNGDVTTNALIPPTDRTQGLIIARENIVLCGIAFAQMVFRQLDPKSKFKVFYNDGQNAPEGSRLMTIDCTTEALLTGERTALNYLQRMSGIASQAAHYVQAITNTGALVLDTRKTTPGWRVIEKYAVQCGGARNHRRGLDDMIMIKDNHLAAMEGPQKIAAAIKIAREKAPDMKIEVEADTLIQVKQAAEAGADIILLDNMPPEELSEAIKAIDCRSQAEASGGITLDNIKEVAKTGVQYISVGALTHSVRAVDISLEIPL